MCKDGRIKILDFGIAGLEHATLPTDFVETIDDDSPLDTEETVPEAIVGTPKYIAPEVWSSRTVIPANDVYSAGLMLWELLAQRRKSAGVEV